MRTKGLQILPTIERAVEIYATDPEVTHQQVADMVGININTLLRIRRDPNFWAKVYDYYMTTFEGDVVNVLKAAVREATAGNVQAQRLVLEHSGKLQKNINITIDSPFENWMKKQEFGEVVAADIIVYMDEFKELPPRTANNSHLEIHKERLRVQNAPQKAKSLASHNKTRREQYKWVKRAKAVGVDKLPGKRPTPGQKKAWQESIIKLEKKAS